MIPVESIEHSGNQFPHSRESICVTPTRFSSEKDLVRRAIAQSAWNDSHDGQRVGVITELETPNGIVDIAYYRLRKDWQSHRLVGEIPSRWAYAFHKIPYRKQFSTDYVATLAGTSRRRAKLALKEFDTLELCRPSVDDEHWMKIRQPIMALQILVSVEAKLRDWRKALDQAIRYLTYSDQAWVLLDSHSVQPALNNIGAFETRNVGLASISTSGDVSKHFEPGKSKLLRQHDRWVVNSEVLKRVDHAR